MFAQTFVLATPEGHIRSLLKTGDKSIENVDVLRTDDGACQSCNLPGAVVSGEFQTMIILYSFGKWPGGGSFLPKQSQTPQI